MRSKGTVPVLPSLPSLPSLGQLSIDPDASSYFTRAGVTDATAKNRINDFIIGLKSLGLYSLLTGCWIGRSAYNAGTGTTVFDLVTNTLNGTMVNSPAWGTDGIVFTGATQAVTTGRTQTMNGSWSAFAVYKEPTGAATTRIFGQAAAGAATLLFNGSATKSTSTLGTYDGVGLAQSVGTFDATAFKMVGVTYSVANKQMFYASGASIGTASVANAAASHTVQLSASSGEGMTNGTMSVGMIFGATELTSTQSASLYSLVKTTICFDQSLP